MYPHYYARALYESLSKHKKEDHEKIVNAFISYLKAKEHTKMLPKIITIFTSLAERVKKQKKVTIISAHAREAVEARHFFKAYLDKKGENMSEKEITEVVDENLIEGYRIQTESTVLDISAKNQLLRLYGEMIATQ